jgi:CRISPR system Cascade subunit CasD
MTATLLLRCSGPMQSWGTQSRFNIRDTGREPSKSGIVGLLCAALGRPRTEPVADLAALKMGVRVDREGRLERDFHTAGKGGYYRISGGMEKENLIVSHRYYLADACFLVGLEGDPALLEVLHRALANPVWPLYLGRKAFVPSEPVWLADGLWYEADLLDALRGYPWLGTRGKPAEQLRLVIEDPAGSVVVNDVPVSFVQRQRAFLPRRVKIDYIYAPFVPQEG